MAIYKTKAFAKFAKKERISDAKLCESINSASAGLIDADYGGGVIKQRIARENQGKSGGYRAIIFFQINGRSFFVHGFAKNDAANISEIEAKSFRDAAKILAGFTEGQMNKLLENGTYQEVECDV